VAIAVVALPYAWAPVYRFPDSPAFAGTTLWNPYATASGSWLRSNLHAHGRAWSGLTSGEQPDAEVAARYRSMGYAVAGVSDYQHIAAFDGVDTIPLYEHGFNLGKNHQLAIGARAVDWFDLPLWQSLSHQQYVINRVKGKADLVSLNHPSSRDAYDVEAVRSLTNYDLIEIVNGPFTAEEIWDSALSSGHPVWALANDDTHDLNDARRTAVGWNMIDAASAGTADVVAALRAGRSYAVLRTGTADGASITTLRSVEVRDHDVTVTVDGAAADVSFVGQEGAVRKTVHHAQVASYSFTPADTYIRAVVKTPQTVLYLNPVVRWDGQALPSPSAAVDTAWTWTQRGGFVLACALLLLARAKWRAAHAGSGQLVSWSSGHVK
jgi:hypothetical protein